MSASVTAPDSIVDEEGFSILSSPEASINNGLNHHHALDSNSTPGDSKVERIVRAIEQRRNDELELSKSQVPCWWRQLGGGGGGVRAAIFYIFLFYLFSPIYYCVLVQDESVCPQEGSHWKAGWISALYFASSTLSTVGYGNVEPDLSEPHLVFASTMYMIASCFTLVACVSVVADASATGKFYDNLRHKAKQWALGRYSCHDDDDSDNNNDTTTTTTTTTPIYIRLRWLRLVRVIQISLEFLAIVLVGVLVNRIVLHFDTPEEEEESIDVTWMISFYWAVQTVTTIGYGDVKQPYSMVWFNTFYLVLSTYFVGKTLSEYGELSNEIDRARREYEWAELVHHPGKDHHLITKALIPKQQQPQQKKDHEKGGDHHNKNGNHDDDKIDQYEFLVASLVQLGKLSTEDVTPIMEKFRALAGPSGFIELENNQSEVPNASGRDNIAPKESSLQVNNNNNNNENPETFPDEREVEPTNTQQSKISTLFYNLGHEVHEEVSL